MTNHPECGVVLHDVIAERWRQIHLRNTGRFAATLADAAMIDSDRLAALGEEFGEVCGAFYQYLLDSTNTEHLRRELIQTAAVCVAWCEYLDKEIVDETRSTVLAQWMAINGEAYGNVCRSILEERKAVNDISENISPRSRLSTLIEMARGWANSMTVKP